jgi:hypothetical protein
MKGNPIRRYTEKWSRKERGTLLITDETGEVVGSYAVTPNGDRPGPEILWRTGWVAYPGTEWREQPPGEWSRAVCEESRTGEKR